MTKTRPTFDCAFLALLIFLAAYVAILGFGWLRQTPSQEELYSDAGRFYAELRNMFAGGRINWWTPDFMQGSSASQYFLVVVPLAIGNLLMVLVGDPAAGKVMGLISLLAAGIFAFFFGRKVSGQSWIGFLAGALYALNAQILLRIASFEHIGSVLAYAFLPLVLLCVLRVAEDGSWRSSFALAASWGAMMLCYTKMALMFFPVAAAFYLWVLFDQPERRIALIRGSIVATLLLAVMVLPLLLPLTREYHWVAAFSFDNFAGWQQAFSMKSFISVLDRANGLLANMRPDFVADRGQFYFGLVTIFSVGAVLWWSRGRGPPPSPSWRVWAARPSSCPSPTPPTITRPPTPRRWSRRAPP